MVAGRAVGPGHPCLIIGEVAQAHDGSLGLAHAFIDAIAGAGADAVKFQTHIAAAESTRREPWRVAFSRQDALRYDYWKRMEFTAEQWTALAGHAADRDLLFLSSPFSIEAAELLERIGVPAWKVASGEGGNRALLDYLVSTAKPLLLSSGMSGWAELDQAVDIVRSGGGTLAVLQCTTQYPSPPERIGLNLLGELRRRYGCPVGLSDHSGTVFPGLAAAAIGLDVLEVHVTLSREMFGPDVVASVTTGELRQLVTGVRYVEKMIASPVDKDAEAEKSADLRRIFGKSLVARMDLAAGTVLDDSTLALKKPGDGIPPAQKSSVIGRRLKRPLRADDLIREEDLD